MGSTEAYGQGKRCSHRKITIAVPYLPYSSFEIPNLKKQEPNKLKQNAKIKTGSSFLNLLGP